MIERSIRNGRYSFRKKVLIIFFFFSLEYVGIKWTKSNLHTMLETIKEWHLLCHDTAEFETLLSVQSPVWKDIASRLRFHHKICSSKCHEKFISVSINISLSVWKGS